MFKSAIIISAGALFLGTSLALSGSPPVGATQMQPDGKTMVKCNKTTPCFQGTNSGTGFGVAGTVQGTPATAGLPGPAGIYGIGAGNYTTGVYGLGYGTSSTGVFGLSFSGWGGAFQSYADNQPALMLENTTTGGEGIEAFMANGAFYLDTDGDGIFSGYVSASQYITAIRGRGGERIAAFNARSTRETIEDTGAGRLVAGEGAVRFDPALANAIDVSRGYQVFITPDGETRGLYVAAKYEGGFVVRETERGHSSLFFDYRVVAHPYGASDARLPQLTLRQPRMPNLSKARMPQL